MLGNFVRNLCLFSFTAFGLLFLFRYPFISIKYIESHILSKLDSLMCFLSGKSGNIACGLFSFLNCLVRCLFSLFGCLTSYVFSALNCVRWRPDGVLLHKMQRFHCGYG
ncbi:MAG: hypothetical protein A3C38_00005 [Planctomycetes bacterium RIFCSPHIGHO2_02_FULL_50_42]|nr:MAG: hypothetical protein A2060_01955 [Planctomycetes bacterium GWA2_50_13]OHB87681.1 MAG: hypothetical protein A3C38_00005 [Planctomycetes bacterium RIFCSPHIGHO2_02_FULL_50_42]OHB95549.1 MAG: hypothetical protein A3I59_07970 [Planctomycetes bacterium RIFCSPLOWO2_02_FULL_50_16]HCN18689.1 hypothetical protein [Planctomycetia bacterium]